MWKDERWCGRKVEAELGGHGVGVDRGERVRVRVELEWWSGAAVARAVVEDWKVKWGGDEVTASVTKTMAASLGRLGGGCGARRIGAWCAGHRLAPKSGEGTFV